MMKMNVANTKEQVDYFMNVFSEYEKKFGDNLYSAWDFDSVDWVVLAKEAESCIKHNRKLTEEQKEKFFGNLNEDTVY